MNEYPILFSGPMIRALLEGRKTQTRRVVKPQPSELPNGNFAWRQSKHGESFENFPIDALLPYSPYGIEGDRLWIREAWAVEPRLESYSPFMLEHHPVWYAADDLWVIWNGKREESVPGRTRPSIHMPRWASRITLEIVSVRVERVRAISESDCIAEGTEYAVAEGENMPAKVAFEMLWNSINEKRGFGWEKNPWVWVIEFRKL